MEASAAPEPGSVFEAPLGTSPLIDPWSTPVPARFVESPEIADDDDSGQVAGVPPARFPPGFMEAAAQAAVPERLPTAPGPIFEEPKLTQGDFRPDAEGVELYEDWVPVEIPIEASPERADVPIESASEGTAAVGLTSAPEAPSPADAHPREAFAEDVDLEYEADAEPPILLAPPAPFVEARHEHPLAASAPDASPAASEQLSELTPVDAHTFSEAASPEPAAVEISAAPLLVEPHASADDVAPPVPLPSYEQPLPLDSAIPEPGLQLPAAHEDVPPAPEAPAPPSPTPGEEREAHVAISGLFGAFGDGAPLGVVSRRLGEWLREGTRAAGGGDTSPADAPLAFANADGTIRYEVDPVALTRLGLKQGTDELAKRMEEVLSEASAPGPTEVPLYFAPYPRSRGRPHVRDWLRQTAEAPRSAATVWVHGVCAACDAASGCEITLSGRKAPSEAKAAEAVSFWRRNGCPCGAEGQWSEIHAVLSYSATHGREARCITELDGIRRVCRYRMDGRIIAVLAG